MKKNEMIRLFALFCFLGGALHAQNVLVSDPVSIRNDYGYELIGRLRDRILLFRDRYESFEIQAFDNNMRLSWSKTLPDLERRDIQILSVTPGINDFSIIFKERKRSRAVLRVHKYDPGANLIDSVVIKDYGDRPYAPPVLNFVRSEDRNCFVVYNQAENNTLEITCFLLDKMIVLWEQKLIVQDGADAVELRSLVAGNKGEFFMLTESNNRKVRLSDHALNIWQIGNRGNTTIKTTIGLPENFTRDAYFSYDNSHSALVGIGLYGEKNKDRVHGAFFIRYIPAADSTILRYEAFDERFFSILRRRDGDDGARGIGDASAQKLILRQDGGALLVGERYYEIVRGTTTGRGLWRDGGRMIVDHYYDDLFILAFHPNGEIHWKTVLHKKQYSQDDEGVFSSFCLVQQPGRLHFLFNDEIRYENTCSNYVINPIGGFDRNSVFNTVGRDMRLRFRDALQINQEECIVPSEFRNKLRLLLVRL